MSIIIMLLLLSVLILVHEAGHFLAARFFGIKVDKFGFGLPFGPTLYETKWGDTKILIHAFLLGGYVSFPDDEKECDLAADSQDRFLNRPIYQRAIVVSAGVVANVICAFIFVFLTAAIWGNLPSGKYEIFVDDIVAPKNESIWQSGIKKGDQIIEINGSKIDNTFSLISYVQHSKAYDGKTDEGFALINLQELRTLNSVLEKDEIIPQGVAVQLALPKLEPALKIDPKVLNGMKKFKDNQINLSAKQKKIRDQIKGKLAYVSDGQTTLYDLAMASSDSVKPLSIKIKRGTKVMTLSTVYPNKKGVLGIKLAQREILIPTKTPKSILVSGSKYLADNTYMMIYGLYQIFTGQVPLKDLHGIVAITKVGGDIIDNSGFFSGLLLIAIISMDLAIVNFLPIPALDGGHIMFLIFEKFRGKPLDEKVIDKIGTVGFMFLISLMVFVIFNDIFGLITKKF